MVEALYVTQDTEEQEYTPPSYSDLGYMIVKVDKEAANYLDDMYEVIEATGCTFWISEGVGYEYWLKEYCEFPSSGAYKIGNIKGRYIRGDWGFTDDDEEWEYESITPYVLEDKETYGEDNE